MNSPPPRLFDPVRRASHLARAGRRFEGADFLHRRAAAEMANSLEVILRGFPTVVDLSPHPGVFAAAVTDSGAGERIGPVRAVAAAPGETALPIADGSADLIVSVLGLHWIDDLPGALAQIKRALKPDGLFLGALFGAGTLKELRGALTEAELQARGGAQARISPFADGYDAAALMQRRGSPCR